MVSISDWQDDSRVFSLKTGVFKWSKDWTGAAIYFEEAAKNYKLAKCHEDAIKANRELVKCNQQFIE